MRLGASISTFNSGTTVAASQRELEAQLLAARAEIDALRAKQADHEKQEQDKKLAEDAARDAEYRRMDANLWDKPILAEEQLIH